MPSGPEPFAAREWCELALGFEAIVCDLAYGHPASVKGVDRDELYRNLVQVAARILVPGRRVVRMLPQGTLRPPPPTLTLAASFLELGHGWPTRQVVVLERACASTPTPGSKA